MGDVHEQMKLVIRLPIMKSYYKSLDRSLGTQNSFFPILLIAVLIRWLVHHTMELNHCMVWCNQVVQKNSTLVLFIVVSLFASEGR
jgi:hypothetical protein